MKLAGSKRARPQHGQRRTSSSVAGGIRGLALAAAVALGSAGPAAADSKPAAMLDPNLQVETYVGGLVQPIGAVFLPRNDGVIDMLVLEKGTGKVRRVVGGVVQADPVLDLAVNSASERGLLALALHPNFPATPEVFIRWTESTTGADTNVISATPLLGNRLDRFVWNGTSLTFAQNLVRLRARQTDNIPVPRHEGTQNPNENGNHNGGPLRFGPDGKLYTFVGDLGRRGWLQNLKHGPFRGAPHVDDTFGGPEADDEHLSGVVLRLNTDGSAPADNPFFDLGNKIGGEVGANAQKIYSYGHRNSFGMAFDPFGGALWLTENADDAFSEINRLVPGANGGWIQNAGPLARLSQFKEIETTQFGGLLQQRRYPPTRIAHTPAEALAHMILPHGATYIDPDFSWKYEVGPAGTAFVVGHALGAEYAGTMWIGSARPFAAVGGTGGALYRFRMTADRRHVDVSADPRLADRVADNLFRPQKFDPTESETLLIGEGFGTTPDIVQGPDGALYVVSISDGVVYRISRRPGAP